MALTLIVAVLFLLLIPFSCCQVPRDANGKSIMRWEEMRDITFTMVQGNESISGHKQHIRCQNESSCFADGSFKCISDGYNDNNTDYPPLKWQCVHTNGQRTTELDDVQITCEPFPSADGYIIIESCSLKYSHYDRLEDATSAATSDKARLPAIIYDLFFVMIVMLILIFFCYCECGGKSRARGSGPSNSDNSAVAFHGGDLCYSTAYYDGGAMCDAGDGGGGGSCDSGGGDCGGGGCDAGGF